MVAGAVYWSVRKASPVSPAPKQEQLSAVFKGVELVDQDPDGTSWRLAAREGAVREGDLSGWLRDVKVELESSGKTVRLGAAEAQIEEGKEIRLSGGVEISWGEYKAQVERATYYRGDGRIFSPGVVTLTGPGLSVRGRGVEVDVHARAAKINQDVSAVVGGANR